MAAMRRAKHGAHKALPFCVTGMFSLKQNLDPGQFLFRTPLAGTDWLDGGERDPAQGRDSDGSSEGLHDCAIIASWTVTSELLNQED